MSLLARIVARALFEADVIRGLHAENQQHKPARARITYITTSEPHRLGELEHADDTASFDEWGHAG